MPQNFTDLNKIMTIPFFSKICYSVSGQEAGSGKRVIGRPHGSDSVLSCEDKRKPLISIIHKNNHIVKTLQEKYAKNTDEVSKERFRLPSPCSRRVCTCCGTVRAAARGRRKNERFSPIFRRVRHRHSLCRHYRICRCCRRCAETHRQQVFQQPN